MHAPIPFQVQYTLSYLKSYCLNFLLWTIGPSSVINYSVAYYYEARYIVVVSLYNIMNHCMCLDIRGSTVKASSMSCPANR